MADSVQGGTLIQAVKVAQQAVLEQAPNGVRYAAYGQNNLATEDLARMVQAVPANIAGALGRKSYYFVPLAMGSAQHEQDARLNDETMVAPEYTPELSDRAICHRNVALGSTDGVFISTRLLHDRFALAFEFFINVGHAFAEAAGVPESFNTLVWEQALRDVRGETSQDAWESRNLSLVRAHASADGLQPSRVHVDEKAKSEFLEAAFADAVAIYLLSLSVDFNYSELREREYPLLAPEALAERLRLAHKLFPPNPGYEFAIRYRRRA